VAFRIFINLRLINDEAWFDSNPRFIQKSVKKGQMGSAEQVSSLACTPA
jgi:hypothetical protein